jgi:predicted HTH domain antitoxin
MRLFIPEDIVVRAEATEADLLLAMAVQLYADNRIDHADACRLSQRTAGELNRELLRQGLVVQQYQAAPMRAQRRRAAG